MRTTAPTATVLALLALAAAPAATATAVERVRVDENLVAVDDLAEGEAGHFVDLRFDSCRGASGPVTVQVNGESTTGRQYALDATRTVGRGTVSFLLHAGSYRVTAFDGRERPLGWRDVRAKEADGTSLRLSRVCRRGVSAAVPAAPPASRSAAPTTTPTAASQLRVPTRIDTGLGPVAAQDPSALPVVATVGTVLAAGALVLGGLTTARRRAGRA